MKAKLREFWLSRAPRERVIMAILAVVAGVASYIWLVQTADQAQTRLRTSVPALREQAARLEQQAAELERLRAAPAISASQTDLRTLVQEQAAAAGLSYALLRIDAQETNQVVAVFGAVPFAEWLDWIAGLRAQHVRLDTCRIEALSTPGLVSVTANLTRANPQ
ncbi:MAG TPA: type II secretion system protein M [Burkholderiales bacterium]|nr:type II secretion system protein M [Burkholderiales bacterium]